MVEYATMKTLAQFKGKVIIYNPDGLSRVQLTDLSNGNSCETDGSSTGLKEAGINYNGCEFEITVVEEHGHPKGIMKKLEPTPPPATTNPSPEINSSFEI